MNLIVSGLNKINGFFKQEKISKRGWSLVLVIYGILVIFRCGLADYAQIFGKQHIIDSSKVLNKEPTLFYVPISLILMILAVLYIFTKISVIEKVFFFSIMVTTMLSISRLIVDYSYQSLFFVNHSLILLSVICFFILRTSDRCYSLKDNM